LGGFGVKRKLNPEKVRNGFCSPQEEAQGPKDSQLGTSGEKTVRGEGEGGALAYRRYFRGFVKDRPTLFQRRTFWEDKVSCILVEREGKK